MKKLIALVGLLVLTSCTSISSVQVTSNQVGKRIGESCATYVLGAIKIGGDNYVHTAAKNGKIKKISAMNHEISGFFPIYYKDCTIISGR
ncbi:MAG: TRL domain-containing protein [Bacteriovoracaceae bacterium]